MDGDNLALTSLAKFAPAAALGCLRPLELCELVEDAVRKLDPLTITTIL
jgi:hypothetical protein